eukprot:1095191-Amphidinium_carterae.2
MPLTRTNPDSQQDLSDGQAQKNRKLVSPSSAMPRFKDEPVRAGHFWGIKRKPFSMHPRMRSRSCSTATSSSSPDSTGTGTWSRSEAPRAGTPNSSWPSSSTSTLAAEAPEVGASGKKTEASSSSSSLFSRILCASLSPLSALSLAKATRDSSTAKLARILGLFWGEATLPWATDAHARRPRSILRAGSPGMPQPPESVWSSDPFWFCSNSKGSLQVLL